MDSKSLLTIVLVFLNAKLQNVEKEGVVYTKSEIVSDINFLIDKY